MVELSTTLRDVWRFHHSRHPAGCLKAFTTARWKTPRSSLEHLSAVINDRNCGLVSVILIDGSFVSPEPTPNEIDLIVVVSADHDFAVDFLPSEYHVISKRRVYQRFGFDLLVAQADSEEYDRYVRFFQHVRLEPLRKKGILRIQL